MTNKNFNNLSNEELISILNQGNLSEEECVSLMMALKEKGMGGSVMAIDDPESEEGRATVEYVEYHKKIPESYYLNMPEEEIEWAREILLSGKSEIEDKKRALIILAHKGRPDVYKILEEYEKNPDPELKIWLNLAIQECQNFLKEDIMGESVLSVNRVTKTGRNEKCPCGSGKKYKKCCMEKV
ncbi:MAG: SEC-C domain-containing protein [Candidatus Pacebacteria bacterium]|nr:SEC-C domain-containing protein [Candidatus Paceibacterota bacterium]